MTLVIWLWTLICAAVAATVITMGVQNYMRYLKFAALTRAIHRIVVWAEESADHPYNEWEDLTPRERRHAIHITMGIFGGEAAKLQILKDKYHYARPDQIRVEVTRDVLAVVNIMKKAA